MSSNSSKKTLYIHCGAPKTGSTSIQKMLFDKQDYLEKENLLYFIPKIKTKHIAGFINGVYLRTDPKRFVKEFKKASSKTTAENILVSDEMFFSQNYYVKDVLIKELKEDYDIKMIYYIRRSFDYFVSYWGQLVQNGSQTNTFIDALGDIKTEYKNNLNEIFNYSKILGKENIIIKPFEKDQWANRNLLLDFLSIFNISDVELKLEKDYNISPSREKIDFKLIINNLGIEKHYLHSFSDFFEYKKYQAEFYNTLDFSENTKLISSFPAALAKDVCEEFYDIESRLAKEFAQKNELFLYKYPEFCNKPQDKLYDSIKTPEIIKNISIVKNKNWLLTIKK